MSKLTSYSRIIQHGNTDFLSGATIPTSISPDFTDGTWLPTDLLDRELFINTATGHLQYRGDLEIRTPIITSGDTSTRTRVIVKEIGPWDMRNNPPTILVPELNPQKKILSIDGVLRDDIGLFRTGIGYSNFLEDEELTINILYFPNATLDINPIPAVAVRNYFYNLANANTDYIDNTINRGWIIIEYID